MEEEKQKKSRASKMNDCRERYKSVYDLMTRNFNLTATLFTRLAKISLPPNWDILKFIHTTNIYHPRRNIFNSFNSSETSVYQLGFPRTLLTLAEVHFVKNFLHSPFWLELISFNKHCSHDDCDDKFKSVASEWQKFQAQDLCCACAIPFSISRLHLQQTENSSRVSFFPQEMNALKSQLFIECLVEFSISQVTYDTHS